MAKKTPRPRSKVKSMRPSTEPLVPVHRWRLCPSGEHYREATQVSPHMRKGKPVRGFPRRGTCAKNPSGRDQLYPEEVREIAERNFAEFMGKPLPTIDEFGEAGNLYDHLIQGWTQYWSDILSPGDPLDPKLVKALIASESGFNPEAWNKESGPARARGLMQVRDDSLRFLSNDGKDLKDHFANFQEDDMLNPNYSICAGIRWMYRKKEIAESRAGHPISWREAVIEYKGYRKDQKKKGMEIFDAHYKELISKT